jgi:hypothetical protein
MPSLENWRDNGPYEKQEIFERWMKSKESGHRESAIIEALDRMHLRTRLLELPSCFES